MQDYPSLTIVDRNKITKLITAILAIKILYLKKGSIAIAVSLISGPGYLILVQLNIGYFHLQ